MFSTRAKSDEDVRAGSVADGADRELGFRERSDLADEHDIECCVECRVNFRGDGDTAARQRQDDRLSLPEIRQFGGEGLTIYF